MGTRVLFTSVCRPHDSILQFSSTDEMGYRLTRGQGLFRLYEHTHYHALHLMAQNIQAASVVLENPNIEQFENELREDYDYIAISFKIWDVERLMAMCELIRKTSPRSKIVVGGYGVMCLPDLFKDPRWKSCIDFVCHKEGVSFLQDVLGEPVMGVTRSQLPKIGSTLPWVNPQPMGTIGIILSGLGCTYRCPFCYTSAYTKGNYVDVMSAEQIYQTMKTYWTNTPTMKTVTIYDENLLDHKEKVDALGQFFQKDKTFGLRKFNYFAFGSLSAVSRYDPEELLLNGLDTVWIGVESKQSALAKRQGMNISDAFKMLHSVGIKTVGSWIIGEDFQTPENIKEDIDFFLSLDPVFQQVSVLMVMPPLGLWASMKQKGRVPASVNWKDYHLYGHSFIYKHFTYEQILDHVESTYRRIYEENGPGLIKALEVNLNGYEFCLRAKNPLLRQDKSQFFATHCKSYYSLLKTAGEFAPSSQVKARVEILRERYRSIFGHAEADKQEKLSDLILRKAEREMTHGSKGEYVLREEPFRRYTYPILEKRPAAKPYTVAYPEGDPYLEQNKRIDSHTILPSYCTAVIPVPSQPASLPAEAIV